jgi:hypothetical protein
LQVPLSKRLFSLYPNSRGFSRLAIVVPANTILATDIEQLIQEKEASANRVMLFDRYVGPKSPRDMSDSPIH